MYCNNCGYEVREGDNFCPACGARLFFPPVPPNPPVPPVPPVGYAPDGTDTPEGDHFQPFGQPFERPYGQPFEQPFEQPSEQPCEGAAVKKKTLKPWQIALIGAVAIALILGTLALIAANIRRANTPYTPGAIEDGEYIHRWADIRFEITDKWVPNDPSTLGRYKNDTTDCGFASVDNMTGDLFVIQFENVSGKFIFDEGDYIDVLESNFNNIYDRYGVDYRYDRDNEINIGGETYLVIRYDLGKSVCYTCVRLKNDVAIVISLTTSDETEILTTLASIKSAK